MGLYSHRVSYEEGEIHMARRKLYLPVLIAAAVAVACAVALSAVSEKAEATFPGKNGRIAYSSYDGPFPKGDLEIYTINASGGGKSRGTNNAFPYDLSWGIRP